MLTKGQVDDTGTVQVTFRHTVGGSVARASLVGEFNGWSLDAAPMTIEDGTASHAVELEPGRSYRFRYVLDGDRWENDWEADAYVPNEFGGDDSVIDLTELPTATPSAGTKPKSTPKPKPKPARAPRKSRAKKDETAS